MKTIIGGVYPALVTPLDTNGRVSADTLSALVKYHMQKSADGFYVCGNTGQGPYLAAEQRKVVTETVVRTVDGRAPVLVHIGAMAVDEACDLADHAARSGASGVSSILPPTYGQLDSVYAYFARIAEAAPGLPVFPYFCGGSLSPIDVMGRLLDIASIGGTKYTGPNLKEMAQIADSRSENWVVFAGMDEQIVFAAQFGAHGSIGSSTNIMLGAHRKIWQLVANGEHEAAVTLQRRVNRVIITMQSFGYAGALREALRILGFSVGDPCLPAMPFEPSRRKDLHRALDEIGFAELSEM